MKTMTADPALLNVIRRITEPTEIVDADGQRVAAIYPIDPNDAEFENEIRASFNFKDLRQRNESERSGGRTTAEVLERIQSQESRRP